MLARTDRGRGMSAPLLVAKNLVKSFPVSTGWGRQTRFLALDGVSLSIDRGRTLAIVGESGCGKSTLAGLLLRLQDPDSGRILLDGGDTLSLDNAGLRGFRRRVQVVFQDPFASLDPRQRIRDVLVRPMLLHGLCDRPAAQQRAAELMENVGLSPQQLERYPHQFSGGQRQRIAIARALSVRPDLIICDEPVSALDVSVQAQVVNLLKDLQRRTGIAFIFISHDLAVVRHLADDVAVMYSGRIVERAPTEQVFDCPSHPYTRALLAAAPRIDLGAKKHHLLAGEPPDQAHPPPGCRFAGRCAHVQPSCTVGEQPLLLAVARGHEAACTFARDLPAMDALPAAPQHTPATLRMAAYRRARHREHGKLTA
jgi:oligopeptide/dipeptide ABC transporter ATP-binding protein